MQDINMNRFDLNTLPKCGAKTRSGEPCKRFGNKSNGRCKLHGGHSTGAKSKEGKLAVSKNAVSNIFLWLLNKNLKHEDIENALFAFKTLRKLSKGDTDITLQVVEVVEAYRVELESTKNAFWEWYGADAFRLIQSALDRYYQEKNSQHMKFHVYTANAKAKYFQTGQTLPEYEFFNKVLHKPKSCVFSKDPFESL